MTTSNFQESIENLQKIAKDLGPAPGLSSYLSSETKIRQVLSKIPSEQKVRIALLSTFSIQPLDLCLILESAKQEIALEVYVGEYNQVFQETYNLESGLNQFKPDVAFYFCQFDRLIPHKGVSAIAESDVKKLNEKILELYQQFRDSQNSLFIFSNLIIPIDFPYSNLSPDGLSQSINSFNQNLSQNFQDLENACVFDLENLAQFHGKGNITHPLLKFSSDLYFSESFMVEVGKKLTTIVKSYKSKIKKCLVLDCDNTLWGGIIGENGIDGIRLSDTGPGSEFYELQKRIRSLYNRGVILALNSKNNMADVLEVLQKHPHMLLKEKDFASIQVNWKNKSENMIAIANDLNIGLDSMVFLDDDPAQRKLVRDLLPEVKVIELPKNPVTYFQIVQTLIDFESIRLTDEDRNRGQSYAAQKERKFLASKSESFNKYLKSLNAVVDIRPSNFQEIARLSQLCQRTNQFNLSTKRYTESHIKDLLDSPDKKLFSLKYKDIFGDDGIVGLGIIKIENSKEWRLDSFLLSCRILGRHIEDVFLNSIIELGKQSSVAWIKADYLPTSKNAQIKTFFQHCDFRILAELEKKVEFELEVTKYKKRTFPEIRIIEN
jgi:FkbH-like protein